MCTIQPSLLFQIHCRSRALRTGTYKHNMMFRAFCCTNFIAAKDKSATDSACKLIRGPLDLPRVTMHRHRHHNLRTVRTMTSLRVLRVWGFAGLDFGLLVPKPPSRASFQDEEPNPPTGPVCCLCPRAACCRVPGGTAGNHLRGTSGSARYEYATRPHVGDNHSFLS